MVNLIVEDGSGVDGANSYVTLDEANTYHTQQGNGAWFGYSPDDLMLAALIRGAGYINATYRGRWPGRPTYGRDQFMDWPRTGVVDIAGNEVADDEIPREVKQAQMEAALRELSTPGSTLPDYTPTDRVLAERVGPLSVQYADVVGADAQMPVFRAIDNILSSLIPRKTGTGVTLVSRL